MIFGSKLLSSFLMSAIYCSLVPTLQTEKGKQWQPLFWPIATLVWL